MQYNNNSVYTCVGNNMRKILLLVIIFGTFTSCTQNKLTETDKLISTAKIWGFLKYYHPEVGKGKSNWDNQLFDILPKIEKTTNKSELSSIYLEWINSLGEVKICKSCNSTNDAEYFNKNFNLEWTQDSTKFTKELCDKLKFIEKNRFQGENYYVSSFNGVGNIKIKNEPEYENFDWKNKKYRILSLFKYWNTIEYFFPYKYQTDKNWDFVLKKSISKFLNPKTELDYHLAMLELIVEINDSHGGFVTKMTNDYFGFKWIPAKFKIIDDTVIITEFYNEYLAKKDDIQIGDVITKVNGESVVGILKEKRPYINASNSSVRLRNSYYSIFNGSTDSVTIEFERNGKIQQKIIERYLFKQFQYHKPSKEKWKIINGNIGYVNLGELEKEDVSKMMDSLLSTKAIIFDIRNYPKGTMYLISNYLNKEPVEFVKFTKPDLSYPGRFIWTKPMSCGEKNEKEYKGKVVLLVNEQTQSHAEFTAMCLQTANNVTTIGSQTSGADGNVSRVELVGGFKTMITGIGVYYPDGRETQRIGIVPNIEIKPTINGIRKGKDEVLEKAIELINE